MRKLGTLVFGLCIPAALLGAAAGHSAQASGDTCTAAGTGTNYTLHITMPAGSEQYGFAFGATGATVTNAVIPGTNGSFSTQALAAGTTAAWISDSPVSGSPVASVTLSGAATGSLRIVPASDSQPTYLSPVLCTFSTRTGADTASFSVDRSAGYRAKAHVWQLGVVIAGAGIVSAKEPEPSISTAASNGATAKPYVQVRQVALKTPGKVTLTIRPSAAGLDRLAAQGSLRIHLLVTFDASSGKSGHKLVSLNLRR